MQPSTITNFGLCKMVLIFEGHIILFWQLQTEINIKNNF